MNETALTILRLMHGHCWQVFPHVWIYEEPLGPTYQVQLQGQPCDTPEQALARAREHHAHLSLPRNGERPNNP